MWRVPGNGLIIYGEMYKLELCSPEVQMLVVR